MKKEESLMTDFTNAVEALSMIKSEASIAFGEMRECRETPYPYLRMIVVYYLYTKGYSQNSISEVVGKSRSNILHMINSMKDILNQKNPMDNWVKDDYTVFSGIVSKKAPYVPSIEVKRVLENLAMENKISYAEFKGILSELGIE